MKKIYAFNLGRVFTLSLAEIFAVFEQMKLSFKIVELYREILIIETEVELETKSLQDRLGGTIKIMEILEQRGRKKQLGPSLVFKDYFDAQTLKEKYLINDQGKIQIGISVYPLAKQLPLKGETKRLGMMIKKAMQVAGYSIRIVLPQKLAISLPSVVVTHEHLLEKGAEIDFLVAFDKVYVAKTLTVQDFEAYGRRDYQRPYRDAQVGMLPPKVAQIMVNLAQLPERSKGNPDHALLDPFVGSGTILQEAMIQNFKGVGADISEDAILGTEKNLEWVKNRYKLPPGRYELVHSDVKDLPEKTPDITYDAVVTEGTLGPIYDEPPSDKEITKNFKDLEPVYLNAFKTAHTLLDKVCRVVVAFPAYRKGSQYSFFPIIDKIREIGYDVVEPLPVVLITQFDFLEVSERKSMIYDRKDQFVSREIFIFKKT